MSQSMFPPLPVLLIDDDEDVQKSYTYSLRSQGITNVLQCMDSREAEALLEQQGVDLVLLDLNMPHVSGRDLLPRIVARHPEVPVIVVTGVDEVSSAVACIREGAFDYLVKPIDVEDLSAATHRALELRSARRENEILRERLLSGELRNPRAFDSIITQDANVRSLFQYIEAVATTPQPVLIVGETGVGKELIAKAVHDASGSQGDFVPVNIAGLDDNVFSDTLFGHKKGAFTGALEARKGLIERASGGTLFLDEIGDLNMNSQVKLLRLLQEREYLPLGSDVARRTDARILVATNQDLQELQRTGKFRDDLYYRLRSHLVRVPPLRERPDDIPVLTEYFLQKAADAMGKRKPTAPPELFTLLANHTFPGNIRELESMVYNAVSVHRSGMLELKAFKDIIMEETDGQVPVNSVAAASPDAAAPFANLHPLPAMRDAEDMLIDEALKRTDGNQTMAAQLLGITRQTLNRHLKKKAD